MPPDEPPDRPAYDPTGPAYGMWTIPGVLISGGPNDPAVLAYLRDRPGIRLRWRTSVS